MRFRAAALPDPRPQLVDVIGRVEQIDDKLHPACMQLRHPHFLPRD